MKPGFLCPSVLLIIGISGCATQTRYQEDAQAQDDTGFQKESSTRKKKTRQAVPAGLDNDHLGKDASETEGERVDEEVTIERRL